MVRLRIAEKRTYEEIAAEMGVTAFYAKAAVQRAWATLRKIARSRGK
jgi:DNA-directed RNA polymerase specialized sigma24 family protein